MEGWVEREMDACEFPDQRLKTRFGKLLSQLSEKIGAALPAACQDWAATIAAYRFFSNPRVDDSIILAGHFAATKARIAACQGPILILHDTTEFSFQRVRPEAIGKTRVLPSARIGAQPITQSETAILNQLVGDPERPAPKHVAHYLVAVAKLGGYLAGKNDGPPGNTVLWRGLTCLTDIHFGFMMRKSCG